MIDFLFALALVLIALLFIGVCTAKLGPFAGAGATLISMVLLELIVGQTEVG